MFNLVFQTHYIAAENNIYRTENNIYSYVLVAWKLDASMPWLSQLSYRLTDIIQIF